MNKADVVFDLILIAHRNPAVAQQPAVQAFNLPSPLVTSQRPTVLRFRSGAIATMWSDHLDATLSQCSIQRVRVIRLVANQTFGFIRHKTGIKRGLNKLGFMRRSTRYVNGDRKARAVCNCHDLAPFATLGFADGSAPFLAGTNVPSIKHSAKSIWPRAYKSSARTFRIWTNTDPGLEVSVTGRAGWISTRDVSPSRASAHDPQNAVHYLARVATWPTSAVSTTRRDRNKRFDQAPLRIC
jgi:hypothetical protein